MTKPSQTLVNGFAISDPVNTPQTEQEGAECRCRESWSQAIDSPGWMPEWLTEEDDEKAAVVQKSGFT